MLHYQCKTPGLWHKENAIPCQDSFAVSDGNPKCIIAAVADGLGSERKSDIGSDIAVQTTVKYCAEHFDENMSVQNIKDMMQEAFHAALNAVWNEAAFAEKDEDKDPNEYDTTLCLAIYNGERLFYGQAGDSGMIAIFEDGKYDRITTQQRNEEGQVFPLCAGPEKWEFGVINLPVSGVLLMTDGVFDLICPKNLRDTDQEIYIPLAQMLLDWFDCTEEDMSEIETSVQNYIENKLVLEAKDDTTVVALINEKRPPKKLDNSYYAKPDLAARQAEIEHKFTELQAGVNKKYENIIYGEKKNSEKQLLKDEKATDETGISEKEDKMKKQVMNVPNSIELLKKNGTIL